MNVENFLNQKTSILFDHWSKHIKDYYPEIEFDILDESLLVKDFQESLQESVARLMENRKKNYPGFSKGFIIGFLSSNIHQKWCKEYLLKCSAIYKNYAMVKALKAISNTSFEVKQNVDSLYQGILDEESNFKHTHYELSKKHFPIVAEATSNLSSAQDFKTPLEQFLTNLENEDIEQFVNFEFDYKFDIPNDFLDTEEIQLIIEHFKA
jgi:hypothetical protein